MTQNITKSISSIEWVPCMKKPVQVHVRNQREGEKHISTREGITPIRPDDLIIMGVEGEEYPIGKDLFVKTYHFGSPTELTEDEVTIAAKALSDTIAKQCNVDPVDNWKFYSEAYKDDVRTILQAYLKHKASL